jgi:heme/copper-type cytochrome/quinol oxidase subunit 2
MNGTGPDRPDLRLGRPVVDPPAGGRRSPARWILLIVVVLVVTVAVGALGYQWGGRGDVAELGPAAPPTSGTGRFSAAGPASASTRAPATTSAKPHLVGTLITRNLGSDQDPNRVYKAVGQGRTTEPRFVVHAGERVRLRLLNRDNVVHSFTIDAARVNLDIFAHTSEAATFRAPLKAGTYSFYCRYRKVGMNGTLVVRRS